MKVDFLIAGVQKGGTSSLDAYLRQHPQISMATVKEPHFFDLEREFAGSAVCYENYHRFFDPSPTARIRGEATPIYTFWPEAMTRIERYNPAMKIVVLLRNPMERAWSAWRMEKRRGTETLSFSEAIRIEAQRSEETRPLPHREFSYVSRGFYSEQIRRVLRHFPDQTLFLKSEYFFSQTVQASDRVLDFLEVDRFPLDTSAVHFQGQSERPIDPGDREFLLDRFGPDIKLVEQRLGWDCSDWS